MMRTILVILISVLVSVSFVHGAGNSLDSASDIARIIQEQGTHEVIVMLHDDVASNDRLSEQVRSASSADAHALTTTRSQGLTNREDLYHAVAQRAGIANNNDLSVQRTMQSEGDNQEIRTNQNPSPHVRHTYTIINGFSAVVTEQEIEMLLADPSVKGVYPSITRELFMHQTVDIINATQTWLLEVDGEALTGKNQAVCVIDTGVDYTHPDFGCTAVGEGEGCNVIGGTNTGDGNNNPMDVQGHGTHVAGTVAAQGFIKGVAKGANIVAVKASQGAGKTFSDSDIVAGIDWCVENSETYNISVITMSLGTNCASHPQYCYNSYCDDEHLERSLATAITNAVAAGISVTVATGNNGNLTHISGPACAENAIRVGSTTKSDGMSSFSNRWALDMLVAPGSGISSTCMGGGLCTKSGTSMATPHVAGAIAILRQYLDAREISVTPKEIENILYQTGVEVDDPSAGRTYQRIDVYEAIMYLSERSILWGVNTTLPGNYPQDWITGHVSVTNTGLSNKITLTLSNETHTFTNYTQENDTLFYNFTSLTDGHYNLTGIASYTDGENYTTETYFYFLDKTPPIINDINLLEGTYATGAQINISITDISLTNASLYINDILITSAIGTNITLNHTFNTTDPCYSASQLINCTYSVIAEDVLGNHANYSQSFFADNAPPRFTSFISDPLLYHTEGNYTFRVRWTDHTEIARVLLHITNGTEMYTFENITVGENLYEIIINASELPFDILPNITYNYTSYANDSLGNMRIINDSFSLFTPNETFAVPIDSEFNPQNTTKEIIIARNGPVQKIFLNNTARPRINLSFLTRDNKTVTQNNLTFVRKDGSQNHSVIINNETEIKGATSFISPAIQSALSYSVSSGTVNLVLNIGEDFEINFSKPVKIILGGLAGKSAGWSRNATILQRINRVCDNALSPTNIDNTTHRECAITHGNDLVIWTYHFTSFGAYTPDPSSPGGVGSPGGGGGALAQRCVSQWECTPWTPCLNGYERRTCEDVNACDPPTSPRPPQEERCFVPPVTEPLERTTASESSDNNYGQASNESYEEYDDGSREIIPSEHEPVEFSNSQDAFIRVWIISTLVFSIIAGLGLWYMHRRK